MKYGRLGSFKLQPIPTLLERWCQKFAICDNCYLLYLLSNIWSSENFVPECPGGKSSGGKHSELHLQFATIGLGDKIFSRSIPWLGSWISDSKTWPTKSKVKGHTSADGSCDSLLMRQLLRLKKVRILLVFSKNHAISFQASLISSYLSIIN